MEDNVATHLKPGAPQSDSVAGRFLDWPLRTRILLVGASFVVYVALFVGVTLAFGGLGGIVAVIPAVVSGWLFGIRIGSVLTALAALLNAPLTLLVEDTALGTWFFVEGGLFGTTALFLVVLVVGSLHQMAKRSRYAFLSLARAERQVRESENRLSGVVEMAVDGIITMTEMGVVESMNPSVEHIFGYRSEEVIGRNVRMLMPEPDHSQHDGYLANYRDTGRKRIIGLGREVTGRRKNGSTFSMELAVAEIQLDERRGFAGTIRDITQRKTAEERLRHRAAMDALISDISTRFLDVPIDELTQEFGRALQALGEAVGVDRAYFFSVVEKETALDAMYEWSAPDVSGIRDKLKTREPQEFVWSFRKLLNMEIIPVPRTADLPEEAVGERWQAQAGGSKSMIWISVGRRAPVFGFLGMDMVHNEREWDPADFPFYRTVAEAFAAALERKRTNQDILQVNSELEQRVEERTQSLASLNEQLTLELGQRRQAEEALRASEVRYRSVAETSPSAIVLTDPQRNITFANQLAVDLLGYESIDDLVGIRSGLMVAPEARSRLEDLIYNLSG